MTNKTFNLTDHYSILLDNPSFVIGVLFMFSFLLLLIYANFGDRVSLKKIFIKILKLRACSCLKCWVVVVRRKRPDATSESDEPSKKRSNSKPLVVLVSSSVSTPTSIKTNAAHVYTCDVTRHDKFKFSKDTPTSLYKTPNDDLKSLLQASYAQTHKDEIVMWV